MGVGRFLSDLYQMGLQAVARTRAAETDIDEARARIDDAVRAVDDWTVQGVGLVLVAADPVTLVGRDDAAQLYEGIAEHIVEATEETAKRPERSIKRGLEAGIDALPADVPVFIKRKALREVPAHLARLLREIGESAETP